MPWLSVNYHIYLWNYIFIQRKICIEIIIVEHLKQYSLSICKYGQWQSMYGPCNFFYILLYFAEITSALRYVQVQYGLNAENMLLDTYTKGHITQASFGLRKENLRDTTATFCGTLRLPASKRHKTSMAAVSTGGVWAWSPTRLYGLSTTVLLWLEILL